MTTHISGRTQTARKAHQCDGCLGVIEPGTQYNVIISVDGRDFVAWKEHPLCGEILNVLGASDDGFESGDVLECLSNVTLSEIEYEWRNVPDTLVEITRLWKQANDDGTN